MGSLSKLDKVQICLNWLISNNLFFSHLSRVRIVLTRTSNIAIPLLGHSSKSFQNPLAKTKLAAITSTIFFSTNNTDLIDETEIVSGVSDHEAVIISSRLRLLSPKKNLFVKSSSGIMLTPLKCKQQRKNFAKFFLDKYHVDDANSDVNEMWSCIPSNLLTTLENNIPSELSSSKLLPLGLIMKLKDMSEKKIMVQKNQNKKQFGIIENLQ